jgi:predicted ATPase
LEEPEAGLHPSLLGARYELLHQFAYPTAGQTAVQILVATHSYQLLRTIKSHHTTLFKQIRVVTSDPTAGTSVRTPAHYPDVARAVEVILSGEDARPTDA